MKLPKGIRRTLDATGRQWQIKPGKKHNLIYLDNHMVAILPHGRGNEAVGYANRNIIAAIRRADREQAQR